MNIDAKIKEYLATLNDDNHGYLYGTDRVIAELILTNFAIYMRANTTTFTYKEYMISAGVPADELDKVEDRYMDKAIVEEFVPAHKILSRSFVWAGTVQGHDFWVKVANGLGGDYD